ncbi:MAG: hypothetical protein HFJ53_02660 [Clostridia bacterium]|jgi:hypothetical protein|nr:hypothetical protein [Clostridia bacterium]
MKERKTFSNLLEHTHFYSEETLKILIMIIVFIVFYFEGYQLVKLFTSKQMELYKQIVKHVFENAIRF